MKKIRSFPNWVLFVIALLFYMLATILITYPGVTQLKTHIAGSYSDNLYFAWQIGWIRKAIFEYHQNPLTTELVNYPYGYSLLFTEISPLQIIFALPFTFDNNPILGFNVSILLTFVLAGLTMFAWTFHLTRSFLIALIIGFAYSFSPYHLSHYLVGHLNLCAIQWFPIYFWGLLEILNNDGHKKRNIALCSLGISAISLTSLYYFYMTAIITLIIFIYYLSVTLFKRNLDLKILKNLTISVLTSIPFLIVGIGPYFIYHLKRGTTRLIDEALTYSASITDFFLPFTKQYFLGKWVAKHFPRDLWIEASLYVGITILILGILGWLKKSNLPKNKISALLLIGFVSSLILGMGIAVIWMEDPVTINLGIFSREEISNEGSLILLPSYLLYKYLPFYAIMRVPMRYGIFALFFICSAAALGALFLKKKVNKNFRCFIQIFIFLIILLDFWITPINFLQIGPREVDKWLAEQPIGGLIQIPFQQSLKQEQIFYTLYHEKPVVSIMPTFPSDRMRLLREELKNFPADETLDVLERESVNYVVIDTAEITITPADFDNFADRGFVFEGEFGNQIVFSRQ